VVQTAREARAANLPIPNIPLQRMTGFAFMDVKFFAPILRDDLHISGSDQCRFIEWDQCNDDQRTEYFTKCPSLSQLARLLDLKLEMRTTKDINSDSGSL